MSGAPGGIGRGSPYPSLINVSGLSGLITNVTAKLNNISHSYPADLDILLVGPSGQTVMLMSDVGGSSSISNITITLSDAATSSMTTSQLSTGTYRPTNRSPSGDADAFASPAPPRPWGSVLSVFNGTAPVGTWSLYVIHEFTSGSGTLAGGWSLTFTTVPAAPLVSTGAATNVFSTSATLNGIINPLGLLSTTSFQLGSALPYSDVQPPITAGDGTTNSTAFLNLSGLRPGTTYHYQFLGQNSVGNASGGDRIFTTAPLLDTDGDGLPDDYETAYGLNPGNATDAALDSDGDGRTNLEEFLAGTDPRNALSVLRLTSIIRSGGDFSVTFPTVFAKRYRLQFTDSLLQPAWTTLEDNIPGTGLPATVSDFAASGVTGQRYYRAMVVP